MSDTIKDYLIGFGFDVDEGGANQIESMLKELDGIVRNLATVLTQATDKVQGFVSNVQQQAQAANQSAGQVEQLAQNTQNFSNEADNGSQSASFFSTILGRLTQSSSETKNELKDTAETIQETGDKAEEASSSVEKLNNAMSGMMKFIKLIAGAAVVKKFLSVAQSLYEYDQNLEATAKSLHKTTEEARAHTKALEVMGKTYEEIKKDKNLKETYDELVAMGESMALPDVADGVDNIHEMVVSFEKLKMVGSYAMQWLYHAVQEVAAGPLARFKGIIDDVTKNLKLNLPKLSVAGAHVIDGILRIVSAFAKGAEAIMKFLDKIPGPIKVIIGLISAAAYLISKGPFGWMVMALTAIGVLLDDFFGYLDGEEATLGPVWDKVIEVFGNIKQAVQDAVEAIKGFITESFGDDGKFNWVGFGTKLGTWLLQGAKNVLSRFGSLVKTWITGNENAGWDEVGEAIVGKIEAAIRLALGVGNSILSILVGIINEAITPESIAALLTNAGDFVKGIFNGIVNAIPKIGEELKTTMQTLLTGIVGVLDTITSEDVMNAVGDFASNFITGIGAAIGQAFTQAGELLKGLVDLLGAAVNEKGEHFDLTNVQNLGKRILDAIVLGIKKAVTGAGDLLTAINTMLHDALTVDKNGNSPIGDLSGLGTNIIHAIAKGLQDVGDAGDQIVGEITKLIDLGLSTSGLVLINVATFAGNLLDAILAEIPNLANTAADKIKSFGSKFMDLLTGEGAVDFGDGIKTFATTFITKLGEVIGSLEIGAGTIITGIADLIREQLKAGNIKKVLGNLGELGKQIILAIGEGIKSAGTGAGDLIRAIGELISSALQPITNDDGTVESLIGDLSGFGITILDALGQAIQDAIDAGGEVVSGLFDAFLTIFSDENIGQIADSVKLFVSELFRVIGDTIGGALDKVGNLDGVSIGEAAGNVVTNLLQKLFGGVDDLSTDPNVTGFVDKIGQGLNDALGTIGSAIGAFAGKLVGYIFSAEGLTTLYNAAKSVGKLIIQGIAEGISGFGNFVLNTIEGVLVGLGLVDQETIDAMRGSAEKLGQTTALAYEQGLDESDSASMMLANWALKGVGKNNSSLDTAHQDLVDFFDGWIGTAAQEAVENGSGPEEFRDNLLSKMVQSFAEANIDDFDLLGSLWTDQGFDVSSALSALNMNPEDFLPNFDDLDFWGAMMTAVQSGDSSQVADLVNNMLTEKIDFGETEEELRDQAGEAISNAMDEIQDSVGDYADDVESSMSDLFSDVDTDAPRQAVDAMATTLTEGKGDVETAADEVADAAVQKFLLTMSNENGAAIAQSFIDGILDKLNSLVDSVATIVDSILSKFNTIASRGSSAFSRVVSAAKSALSGLPEYVSGIVDKVNKALDGIKSPTIKVPTVGSTGSTPHSSEGRQVDHEMITRVGEGDKREYIIPVTKPNRAVPLLERAAADLGLTVESYKNATKLLGGSPDKAVTPAHAAAAMTNNSVANHYSTIDAHANINVYGSDPRSTANNVNKSHEQVLLRNVKPLLT